MWRKKQYVGDGKAASSNRPGRLGDNGKAGAFYQDNNIYTRRGRRQLQLPRTTVERRHGGPMRHLTARV